MIGFDFDGVLVADMMWNGGEIDKFLQMRNLMYPLFKPQGDQVIVTGRPNSDIDFTSDFVGKYFRENSPKKVFHDNDSLQNAAEYKAQVIIDNGIDLFIESDPGQVFMIQAMVGDKCKVIHFEKVIHEAISNLSRVCEGS